MGSGIIVVMSKDGKPLRDQEVNMSWTGWFGISTGIGKATSNNFGEAVFNGNPAFSAGQGQIKGPFGEFANFRVETDAYGNFPRTPVQVSWNPVGSVGSTITETASGVAKAVIQIGIIGAVIAIVGLIGLIMYKKSPYGSLLSKVRR